MHKQSTFILRSILKGIGIFFLLLIIGLIILVRTSRLHPPKVDIEVADEFERETNHYGIYQIGNNWLRYNYKYDGMYEMYIEGSPFERGVIYGKLAKELVEKQEKYFVDQIQEIVPSKSYLNFLKYLIFIFNRNLDKHIPIEYLQEIYGVSLSASDDYKFIGSNYERILNYHAAHDIGHALNEYMKVGCTSVAVWGDESENGQLLIGRNFDFYVGDDFAKEKIVCFVKPEEGIPFGMVTWGGMIGAVSGMNKEGLTVTINAAKSDLPKSAATPISILAREILQYASTIDEAYAIAEKRKTFVSESLLIGSKNDGQTAIIEKSPKRMAKYEENDQDIICTNHYQGSLFQDDVKNEQFKEESSTVYRHQRVDELKNKYEALDFREMALILRDRNGLNDEALGMGNEFALNQLIAHHSIIFKPEENIFWVSSYPYQLGSFVAYDLDEVFNDSTNYFQDIDSLLIPTDSFLFSDDYEKYGEYLDEIKWIVSYTERDRETDPLFETLEEVEMLNATVKATEANPEHYLGHKLSGDLFMHRRQYELAKHYYEDALTKKGIPLWDKEEIASNLEMIKKKENK